LARKLRSTRIFDKSFQRLPKTAREQTLTKLDLFLGDASHPSLRVKRLKGSDRIWEMSITMNYRVTFEIGDDQIILRRIGTHDILRNP